jgi:hypothetical protein
MFKVRFGYGKAIAPLALLALAACGGEEAEPTYEAGVEDRSGELIVSDPAAPAVPVDLPDTPMTDVPADEADAATDAATPAPDPAPDPANATGSAEAPTMAE